MYVIEKNTKKMKEKRKKNLKIIVLAEAAEALLYKKSLHQLC